MLSSAKALELLCLADLQPELDDDHASVDEQLLELVDLVVGSHPVRRGAKPFDALYQHPAIPGAVEDGDAAASRQVAPKAPQIGMRALFVGGSRDRNRHILASV